MAFPRLTKVATALQNRSNIDLSCQHVTTSDFLQYQVSKIIPIVPGQSVSIDHECFMRMDPMPVPTFGRCNVHHRAFYVPFRTIFTPWDDFITDTPHVYTSDGTIGIVPTVPTFGNDTFLLTFIDDDFSTVVNTTNVESMDGVDFCYSRTDDIATFVTKRKFTPLGRWAYKLLRSLGYNFNWSADDKQPLSILPILACIRIYYDYYYPSQYINDSDSGFLLSILNREKPNPTYFINEDELRRVFKILYNIPYSSDYFTSAWDNPVTPNDNLSISSIQVPDVTLTDTNYLVRQDSGTGTAVITKGIQGNSMGYISQYAITALQNLSDYLKRHQLAGHRAIDRYLTRFGVSLPNESLKRCIMLDEWQQELQFGDVTSTADTDGAGLGYYAGKGISYGQGSTDFTSEKEYGYIVIISTIIPVVQYYQGMHRMCQHLSKLDFFTPEFDNLGTQAVASKELYCTINGIGYDPSYTQRVFGFLPRYAEYKVPYSQLTGDLSLNSFDKSNSGWTLFRDIQPFVGNNPSFQPDSYDIEHSLDFVMATDNAQYNRIFYKTDEIVDHFKVVHSFRIKSSFPGKSLWDDYEFKDEDKANKVTMKVNGSSVD